MAPTYSLTHYVIEKFYFLSELNASKYKVECECMMLDYQFCIYSEIKETGD